MVVNFLRKKVHPGDLAGGFSDLEMTWLLYCQRKAIPIYLTVMRLQPSLSLLCTGLFLGVFFCLFLFVIFIFTHHFWQSVFQVKCHVILPRPITDKRESNIQQPIALQKKTKKNQQLNKYTDRQTDRRTDRQISVGYCKKNLKIHTP